MVDQSYWVTAALALFGRVFGGGTAYPKARGIWRDDEREDRLIFDEPVIVHCFVTPEAINDDENLIELTEFCRRMGRETGQGEVGLVIADEYFSIRNFEETRP